MADDGNHRVVKFDASGAFLSQWTDTPHGKMVEPVALATVADGLIVVDNETGQVHKFTFDGKPVEGFEHDLALFRPRGLAVDTAGGIYIADTGRNRLLQLSPDGAPAGEITLSGALNQPTSLTFDDAGNLLVAEPDARRINKIAPDGSPLAQWSMAGNSTVLPPHLLWLPGQGLLASQPEERAIVLFSADGQLLQTWTSSANGDISALARPLGLALTKDRQSVWVVSNGSNQLLSLALPAA